MKGVIFVEFMEFVDQACSPEMTEGLIEAMRSPTGGAYTTVGDYDSAELLDMVAELTKLAGVSADVLCQGFGKHLFPRLYAAHASWLSRYTDLPSFLAALDGTVHSEVRKIHQSAKPPTIQFRRGADGELRVAYRSRRPLADVAQGLLAGCIAHFGGPAAAPRCGRRGWHSR